MSSPTLNWLKQKENKKKTAIGASILLCIFLVGFLFSLYHKKSHKVPVRQEAQPQFVSLTQTKGFTEGATQSVLGTISQQEKDTEQSLQQIQAINAQLQEQNQALQSQIDSINQKLNHQARTGGAAAAARTPVIMSDFSFARKTMSQGASANPCPLATCVLPGTFARAILIGAADADASVNGQSNTTPLLFRIIEGGTMPNGYRAHLKNCFVIGSVYGDISSERGQVKLQTVSCVKKGIPIVKTLNGNGLAYDDSGRGGIRGIPVMRNYKVLLDAGLSGFASGLGSALAQTYTTQSISPLGSTSQVNSNAIAQYSAATGASSALSKLSDYYIKRANQYHPIIQLNPGAQVDLVFLTEFNLAPDPLPINPTTGLTSNLMSPNTSSPVAAEESPSGFNFNNLNLGDNVPPGQAAAIKSQLQQALNQTPNLDNN